MIKTVRIVDRNDIINLLMDQSYIASIERYRSKSLYRGMPNVNYKLATSLQRNCQNKQKEVERAILRNFTKYAAIEAPNLVESIWNQIIIGQHHGLPTRLLDWTYSPLVGMHFATSGEDLSRIEENDAVLWKIDILEMNSLLPNQYQEKLKAEKAFLFTVDMLNVLTISLTQYDCDMKQRSMVLIEPPSMDQRIINQYSYFSIVPEAITDIESFLNEHTVNTVKYIIDKSLKWWLRDLLDQMNINERIIYPGLDGLATWLKRRYYVKNK